jgi:hypothetical protein
MRSSGEVLTDFANGFRRLEPTATVRGLRRRPRLLGEALSLCVYRKSRTDLGWWVKCSERPHFPSPSFYRRHELKGLEASNALSVLRYGVARARASAVHNTCC